MAGWLLAAPAALFLLVCFVVPVLQTLWLRVGARTESGVMVSGWTLENYRRVLATDLYWRVLPRTVRMATSAAIVAATVGDPLAWVVAPGQRDGADVHAAARLNPGA